MGDTDFATAAGASDEDHKAVFGEGLGGDEGERYLDGGLLPRFDRYILRCEGAEGRVSDKGMAYVHAAIRVEEGPEGTKGRTFFPDLFLKVNRTRTAEGGSLIELSNEDWQKSVERLKKRKNRVGRVLGLATDLRSYDEEDVKAYAAQFGGTNGQGVVFIGAVGVQKARGEYDAKNILIWDSLAAPSEPARDAKKNVIAGKTALDDAGDAIKTYAEKEARKGTGKAAAKNRSIDPRTMLG